MSHLTRKQLRLRELGADERAALDFYDFQLGTVRDYMEPPGSPELADGTGVTSPTGCQPLIAGRAVVSAARASACAWTPASPVSAR